MRASTGMSRMPKPGVAASISSRRTMFDALSGFKRSATRLMEGMISFRSCSRFGATSGPRMELPVMFPLMAADRPEDAFREIQLARQPDPLSLPVNSDLGFHYYYRGRYDEAVKQLKFVLELDKDFPPAHLWLGRTYQELGRFDDALAEFAHVENKLPEWPVSIAARGFVAGTAGRSGPRRFRHSL